MSGVRVLVADDHSLVRAGFCALLRGIPGVEVVGEAADGHEALALAGSLRPDVALVDIGMPKLNGIEVATRLAKDQHRVRVVILSMHSNQEYVWQAMRAGVAGYLLKDATPGELELAIRAVMRGDTHLTPAVSRQVLEDYRLRAAGGSGPLDALTPRQREILQMIAEGRTTKDIAYLLNVGVKTVETHRAELMDRLGIRDVAGLTRLAVRAGLVPPDK